MREAVRFVMIRNLTVTASMLALVQALIATHVVFRHRDIVCLEVAGLGGLHELQDVKQELQVLRGVLLVLSHDLHDTVARRVDGRHEVRDNFLDGLSSILCSAEVTVRGVTDVADEVEFGVQAQLVGDRALVERDDDVVHAFSPCGLMCFLYVLKNNMNIQIVWAHHSVV